MKEKKEMDGAVELEQPSTQILRSTRYKAETGM